MRSSSTLLTFPFARRSATSDEPSGTAMNAIPRTGMVAVTSAPAVARMLDWVAPDVPGANVTMYPLVSTGSGVGAGVGSDEGSVDGSGEDSTDGSGVGSTVGSGSMVGAGVGSVVGSGSVVDSGVGSAVGAGVGSTAGSDGSAEGVALGSGSGSAAATGTAANRVMSRRNTCSRTRNRMVRSRRAVRTRIGRASLLPCRFDVAGPPWYRDPQGSLNHPGPVQAVVSWMEG